MSSESIQRRPSNIYSVLATQILMSTLQSKGVRDTYLATDSSRPTSRSFLHATSVDAGRIMAIENHEKLPNKSGQARSVCESCKTRNYKKKVRDHRIFAILTSKARRHWLALTTPSVSCLTTAASRACEIRTARLSIRGQSVSSMVRGSRQASPVAEMCDSVLPSKA